MDIRTEAAIAAFVPSLALLALVYSRDRYEKEPKWLVAKLYVMSIVAVALAFLLESTTRPRLSGAVVTVLGSGTSHGVPMIGCDVRAGHTWRADRLPCEGECMTEMPFRSLSEGGSTDRVRWIPLTHDA